MSNPPPGIVSASYFASLCDKLAAERVDVEALLRLARLDAGRLARAGEMLSHAEVEAFVTAARQLTGRTDIAFEMGRGIKMNSHDVLGYAMISCKNLDQVMRLVSRHYHLMTTLFTLRYRRQGGIGEAVYTPTATMAPELLRFYLEAIAVAHQNQLASLLGGNATGYAIPVAIPPPAHHGRYFRLAPARFHFNDRAIPGVRAVMDATILDALLPMAALRVVEQVEERLAAQRVRAAPERDWGAFVRMMLRESRGVQLTLDDIAGRLQVSPRTVERSLKKEKLGFRELSQQQMHETACELLRAKGATVSQVSALLGFSAVSSFSRAFRRVGGIGPAEFLASEQAPSPLGD